MSGTLPYQQFAKLAAEKPTPAPEPMNARERAGLPKAALTSRVAEEVAYLSSASVLTHQQEECMRTVRSQLDLVRNALPGSQDSIYVLGPSGVGKSTAVLRAAIDTHNEVLRADGQEGETSPTRTSPGWVHALIPVLFVNVRSDARSKSVCDQILSALMEGEPRGSANSLANQLQKILPRHGTTLLVLDDTHNLGTQGTEAQKILQTVKNLNTELGMLRIATVYLGNPDKDSGEYNLTLHDQLFQRLLPFEFKHFDFDLRAVDDPPQNLAWAEYLMRWEQALRAVLPDLREGEIASALGRRLWNRTHGSPGALIGVLKRHTRDVLVAPPSKRLSVSRDGLMSTPVPMKYQRAFVSER